MAGDGESGTGRGLGAGSVWHAVDLDRTIGRLPALSLVTGASPTLSLTGMNLPALSLPGAGGILIAKAQPGTRRVPAGAFVSVGRGAKPTGPVRPVGRRGVANDNGRGHSVWRDVFFLAILAATVAGAFWSGRVHGGVQRVIVVPGPSSFHSVVT